MFGFRSGGGGRQVLLSLTLLAWATPAAALQWELNSSSGGEIPVPNGGTQQTACVVGDLDGDGIDDFVVGERTLTPSLVAYFWRPSGWLQAVIDPGTLDVEAGGVIVDIDGDGDQDLLLGGDNASNQMWWWENPGSLPYPPGGWTRRLIKDSGRTHHHDQAVGDFDGDGELELAFWNQNDSDRLFLADFPADPRATEPWSWVEIFNASDRIEGMTTADINLDGKTDIVGGGYWFEHTGGFNYTPHLIEAGRTYTRTVVGQFVPGGRPEIVISPGDADGPLRWYQWDGAVWQPTELDPWLEHGHSLSLGDVDHDGRLDFHVAEMHSPGAGEQAESRIYLNQGGGVFALETISVGLGNHESRLADVNGDGWLDVVGKPFSFNAPGVNVWLQVPGGASAVPERSAGSLAVAPNPFNARCSLRLQTTRPQVVTIAVHDVRGRQVATLATGVRLAEGEHEFVWDGRTQAGAASPSGTYFFRVSGSDRADIVKVVLVK